MTTSKSTATEISLEAIKDARACIAPFIEFTPLRQSQTLSAILGCKLFIKFESAQFTASFKERGALNKLLSLPAELTKNGVIAMSAGNHAKGVAYHARRLGIPATIVMPTLTPFVKVDDTGKLGADVVLHGDSLDQATDKAHQLAEERKLTFIHPFDDPAVINGQGTLGLEIFEQVANLDAVVVPIGGGGLISGIAVAIKALKPEIKVIGVQSLKYPSAIHLLKDNVEPSWGATIAEGIAVKKPGKLTGELIKEFVDDILLVDEQAIEDAVCLYLNIEKTVAEGAGAAGLAAVLAHPDYFRGKRVATILTGANIDTRILATILMRNLARTGRITRLNVRIDDTPGALAAITAKIGEWGGNILEVSHQRTFGQFGIKEAELSLTIETRDTAHAEEILRRLGEDDLVVTLF